MPWTNLELLQTPEDGCQFVPRCGATIENTIAEAIEIARANGIVVMFKFNDVFLKIDSNSDRFATERVYQQILRSNGEKKDGMTKDQTLSLRDELIAKNNSQKIFKYQRDQMEFLNQQITQWQEAAATYRWRAEALERQLQQKPEPPAPKLVPFKYPRAIKAE